MARKPRLLPPGMPAHIVQRGNNRQVCFASDHDMRALANWLAEGAEKYGVSIHAWVFMTNHFHLLASPIEEGSISKCMQFVGRYYVRYFNNRFRRSGTLFEGRFKAHLVQTDSYFLQCMRYIELNPVRAGMVKDPADYSWSSYAAHAFGVDMRLWSPHGEYIALGQTPLARQSAYRDLFKQDLGADLVEDIHLSTKSGFVLGSDNFKAEVEALSGVPQVYQKRGPRRGVRRM